MIPNTVTFIWHHGQQSRLHYQWRRRKGIYTTNEGEGRAFTLPIYVYRTLNDDLHLTVKLFNLQNIKKKAYGSTEAFVADVKWILHNCIVFNGSECAFLLSVAACLVSNNWYQF